MIRHMLLLILSESECNALYMYTYQEHWEKAEILILAAWLHLELLHA